MVSEGDTVVLRCSVPGLSDTSGLSFTWRNQDFMVLATTPVLITSVSESGVIACFASSNGVAIRPSSVFINLIAGELVINAVVPC